MSEESLEEEPTGLYEGETENGVRHGYGTYIFPSGARYTGTWDHGLKHGTGTFIYPDGSRYEGQWWKNRKHGQGRYYYPNGDIYDGMWCLDKRQGHGLYWDEEKKFHAKGYFSDGNLNGPGLVLMSNVQFQGNFVNGMPVGEGSYWLPNGIMVKGEFKMLGQKTPVWSTTKLERSFMANE